MRINDLYAQIEKEREAEQQAALALATQRGRIAGMQTALELLDVRPKAVQTSGITLPVDPTATSVIIKTPPFVGPTPTVKKTAKPKAAPRPAGSSTLMQDRRQKIIEVLTAESPLKAMDISRRSGIPDGSLHRHLNDPVFARQPDGRWALAVQTSAPVEPAKLELPKVELVKPVEPKPVKAVEPKPTKQVPVSHKTQRLKIAGYLSHTPATVREIAHKIIVSEKDVAERLKDDPWFDVDKDGRWHITPTCRQEYFDDSNPATGD